MEDITPYIEMIKNAVNYTKETVGEETVKTAAHTLVGWVKGKFSKKSEQRKLEAFETEPENETATNELTSMLNDAIEDEDIDLAEVKEQAESFEKVLKENDPQWLNQNIITKTNTQTISGTGNIGVQDVSGGSVSINK